MPEKWTSTLTPNCILKGNRGKNNSIWGEGEEVQKLQEGSKKQEGFPFFDPLSLRLKNLVRLACFLNNGRGEWTPRTAVSQRKEKNHSFL